MAVIKQVRPGVYMFFCKGCGYDHYIWTKAEEKGKPEWKFNEDLDKPTFTPSVHITTGSFAQKGFVDPPEIPPTRCHFFITNGMIRYLGDCTHNLKNQTIQLENILI